MRPLEKSDTRQLASSLPTPPCLHAALCHHGRSGDHVKGLKGFGAVRHWLGSLSWSVATEA